MSERLVWLLRNTRGMVKILEIVGVISNKSVIRSQAPKVVMIDYGEGSETKWWWVFRGLIKSLFERLKI